MAMTDDERGPAGRRAIPRWQWLGWAALAATALVVAVAPRVPLGTRYWILLATVPLLGLPHGALDHLTPSLARGTDGWRWMLGVGALYLVAGGAVLVAWLVHPALTLAGFLVLTLFHWGQGDLYPLAAGGVSLGSPLARVGTIIVRGGIPMIVPLAAFHERYAAVLDRAATLFGAPPEALAWITNAPVRPLLIGGLAAATIATVLAGAVRRGERRAWRIAAGETALLWLFFLTVPPLVAIAVYFTAWHSLRHLARLWNLAASSTASGGTGRLLAHAVVMSVGALVLFAGLAVAVSASPSDPGALAGVYLVTLAALTLPHTVVVSWLDSEQGLLWRRLGDEDVSNDR